MLTRMESDTVPLLVNIIKSELTSSDFESLKDRYLNLVLYYGANINGQDDDGYTALMCAIWKNSFNNNMKDIIVLLLSHGADVNFKNNTGRDALGLAVIGHCHNNMKDIIVLLLGQGANVNNIDKYGDTALRSALLHQSIQYNMIDIIIFFLLYGANVNVFNEQKTDALSRIAERKGFYIFDTLVREYSPQGTLKNLCLRFIFTYPELFKNNLDVLPSELHDLLLFI